MIQIATVGENVWAIYSLVNELDKQFIQPDGSFEVNITGLSPGQYNTRIYSYNSLGSSATVHLDLTFEIKKEFSGTTAQILPTTFFSNIFS